MRTLRISFDPWRGGFELKVGSKPQRCALQLFDGRFYLHTTTGQLDGKIISLETYYRYRVAGLEWRQIKKTSNGGQPYHYPGFSVALGSDGSHSGPPEFRVKQQPDHIEFFGTDDSRRSYPEIEVFHLPDRFQMWCRVDGLISRIHINTAALALDGPIEALHFSAEDFK
jgi:hypothetical protein